MKAWLTDHPTWVYGVLVSGLCLLLMGLAPPARGVYAIEGNLAFTPPNAVGAGNAYRADTSNAIFFAAAVEREYNVTPEFVRVASTNATLYGIGVRDGSRVTLPDRGGQWGSNFNRPYLRVEVVSSSAAESQARFDAIVARVRSIAVRRQADVGVAPSASVTLELNPSAPSVVYVSGRRSREFVAGVLLAGLAGVATTTLVSRRRRRTLEAQTPRWLADPNLQLL